MRVQDVVARIESSERLDAIAGPLGDAVKKLIPRGMLKDVLSGTWLGHPLHPVLTDIPIGSFTSATLLDLVGGRRGQPAANLLATVGAIAVVPTAAAGLADWSDTYGSPKRVGVVHAAANVVGVSFYIASIAARRRHKRMTATTLGLLGMGAMTVGGDLGGHLSFVRGIGVNRTFTEEPSSEWTTVATDEQLIENTPLLVEADGIPVVLYRSGATRYALSNTCTHAGGPLNEGKFDQSSGAGPCVTCPWHQSMFALADGSVIHGPATAPEPTYEVRVVDGSIQVRRR